MQKVSYPLTPGRFPWCLNAVRTDTLRSSFKLHLPMNAVGYMLPIQYLKSNTKTFQLKHVQFKGSGGYWPLKLIFVAFRNNSTYWIVTITYPGFNIDVFEDFWFYIKFVNALMPWRFQKSYNVNQRNDQNNFAVFSLFCFDTTVYCLFFIYKIFVAILYFAVTTYNTISTCRLHCSRGRRG